MNICVYTGAYVLVEEYGGAAPCDLYLVGEAIIARFGSGDSINLHYPPDQREITHRMKIARGWFREDLGVAVVPLDDIEGEAWR